MANADADDSERRRVNAHFRRLSYRDIQAILSDLRRFQVLIQHASGIRRQGEAFPPLESLIPKPELGGVEEEPLLRREVIRRHINHLIPAVRQYLDTAAVNTVFVRRELETLPGRVPRQVARTFDIIEEAFSFGATIDIETLRPLMNALDQGIGFYSSRAKVLKQQRRSAITWLSWIVSVPARVLERAGLEVETASSRTVQIWGWFVRLLLLAILIVAFARIIGIKIDANALPKLIKAIL